MQSVSVTIWTRVAVSISYDNNHYPTGTSFTKTVISSAYAETFSLTRPARGAPRKAGLDFSSLSLRSRGSKARTLRGNLTGPTAAWAVGPTGFHTYPTHWHPARPYLTWNQGSHSNHPLRLTVSNCQGTVPTVGKGASLTNAIGRINSDQPELEVLTASATTSRSPSSAKIRMIIAFRLHPTRRM